MFAGIIAFLCIFAYAFWVYLPQTAEMHRTGLPQKPDHFVNREDEQWMIMQSVTGSISQRSRIITITGSPGYGKTTLANVCGHRFVSQGIRVRYVELQHVCTIKGIIVKILHAVGSTVRDPSMEQLSMWARQWQKGVLVLVLDNVDCFTLSGEGLKKEFSRLIKDFIVKPSLAIHVILTTQYQLGYIDSFQLVPLKRLSESHAKELLLLCHPSLTANVTSTLANVTDGNPLALRILSALLRMPNAPPIPTLLQQMDYDPVQALSPENVHEKLNHVFKVAIGYLSEADLQCFLVVCQFPDSFDDMWASVVLSHFVNESTHTCLKHLWDRSLLEYNRNTQQYIVIPLLRAFVNSTSQRYRVMVSQFFQVYAKHLLHTAAKKQLLSEVHFLNYLKANYLGVQYVIIGFVGWSSKRSDTDDMVHLMLPFALSTFNILPLLQPVDVVEEFWFSVQKLTWNITSEGIGGQCHEYLEQAIELEALLADYVFSTGRNNTVEAVRLSSHAQMLSIHSDKLQLLAESNCMETLTLLRYLGNVAKCSSHDKAVYQNLLKAIMHIASTKNHSSNDADVGLIYFELKEYKLAVDFLNRSLSSKQGIQQQLNVAKAIVLSLQRSGQQELAVDTATNLLPSVLEQAGLEFRNGTEEHRINHLNATDFYLELYPETVEASTEMLNRLADRIFAAVDLSIHVNATELSLTLIKAADVLSNMHLSLSPTINFYKKNCIDVESTEIISNILCLTFASNITRHFLVHMRYQVYQVRVLCERAKAMMRTTLNDAKMHADAQNQSQIGAEIFRLLVDMEFQVKKMLICSRMETDSVECQMSRSQVQLLWQMQYELADGLALFFYHLDLLEQAKNYTEIAIDRLPKSSVKKKWKIMVDHKLNLAKIELCLGNYWNAVYILRNCSLTIDKEMIEIIEEAAESTRQSHDLSLSGHFSVLVHQFYLIFSASKLLAAVVSGAARLISRTGAAITASHLLFAAIVVLLWLSMFTFLILIGSAVYCIKLICSRCSGRHNCLNNIRLLFSDLIIVMCLCSHVVVFYAYVLHFHTSVLLHYLNFI